MTAAERGPPRLHVVTDDAILTRPDFLQTAEAVMDVGREAVALHVRGPHTSGAAVYEIVTALRPFARRAGSELVVNDRVDVALATDLGVVHLGSRSLAVAVVRRLLGEGARIGASAHGVRGVQACRVEGADLVLLGNVYETASHPGRPALGEEVLREAVGRAGDVPVLAIGGVDVRRVERLTACGAYGVAVVSGVWCAPDPAGAVSEYISALRP